MKFENNIMRTIPDSLKTELIRILNDTVHGSSIIEKDTISFLKHVLSYNLKLSKKSFFSVLLSICQTHSSMALIINFSNDLFMFLSQENENLNENINNEQVLHYLIDVQNQQKKSDKKIMNVTLDHLLNYSNIATISSSGTVKNCMKYLSEHNKKLNITCAESRPKCEGMNQAIELASMNVKTTLMTDVSLFSNIQDFDCIVVGADAIVHDGIVNKIGTYPLALLASFFKIPIYCITKSNKILPHDYKLIEENEKPSKDIIDKNYPDLNITNYYFDITPINLFNAVITEDGLITTKTLSKMMKTKILHPKIKDLYIKSW